MVVVTPILVMVLSEDDDGGKDEEEEVRQVLSTHVPWSSWNAPVWPTLGSAKWR